MWNETNPTSLYLGTTWELISDGKYVKTGDRALQSGGSNSITLNKENLPAIKLRTDTATATTSEHYHYEFSDDKVNGAPYPTSATYVSKHGVFQYDADAGWYSLAQSKNIASVGKSSNAGGGTTGSFSLQTEALGSGNAITIQPEYITLKFWKRTS